MKTPYFAKTKIEECEKENLRRNLIYDNIDRGKILAVTVIVLELILFVVDIVTSLLKVDHRFQFNQYLFMYSSMIFINIIYLMIIEKFKSLHIITMKKINKMEFIIVVYITLIMTWGSVVSLMDQKLYGQLMAFMVNMITPSVLYYLDHKKMVIPYSISVFCIAAGLPFVQGSKDILIGHYVNLIIFVVISWLSSRIIYMSYVSDFNNKLLLKKSKLMLEKKIEQNKDINNKLSIANLQLKKLALIDELTGIPNRRGFKKYIDIAFDNYVRKESTVSVLLIDIDFFKQFNDKCGHEEGDKVLIAVANLINSFVRNAREYAVRWGGEEFIFAIINSNSNNVKKLAEMIRLKINNLRIPNELTETINNITVSIGTCTMQITSKDDVDKVIKYADDALYLAKNSGRNCIKSINDEA